MFPLLAPNSQGKNSWAMCWQHSWEMIRWNLCRKKEELEILLRRPLTMTIIHEMMLTAPRSLRVECFFSLQYTRETILLGNQVWHITKHSRFLLLKPTLIPLFLPTHLLWLLLAIACNTLLLWVIHLCIYESLKAIFWKNPQTVSIDNNKLEQ